MRDFLGDEASIASELFQMANVDRNERVEFLAAVDTVNFQKIDFRTDNSNSWVLNGPLIDTHLDTEGSAIFHHNHIGRKSLSCGDWFGMVDDPRVTECWVHCWDGTLYQGHVNEDHQDDVRAYCRSPNGPNTSEWSKVVESVGNRMSSMDRCKRR